MTTRLDGGLVVTINAGSSSLKVAAFRVSGTTPREVLRLTLYTHGDAPPVPAGDTALLAGLILPATREPAAFATALLATLPDVRAVVHRVVHGGEETAECVALDAARIAALRALSPLAPLHQPPAMALIEAVAAAQPSLPQFAGLDTAFHAGMPAVARTYALPAAIRARHPELHAYGFHGLSCRAIVTALARRQALPPRLVIAHLGSGASVTAVRDGRSIATSMGFSALTGLPMATRSGSIDPGVLLHLLRTEKPDVDQLEHLLYRESGLLGLSGLSGDMRTLLASDAASAAAAVEFFVYRAAQEIAAMAVALDGIDTLVFTGGIGEHQPAVRERIVARLHCLGGTMNVMVMPCDEEVVMATGAIAAIPASA